MPNTELIKLADLFGYDSNNTDMDEQEYALAILMLLETFYRKYTTKNINYYRNHFTQDINKLEKQLLAKNEKYFTKYTEAKQKQLLTQQNIPPSKINQVKLNLNLQSTKEVMVKTIKKAINYLKEDVILKIKVWEDRNELDSEFQVDLKLRNFVKDIKKGIKYTTNTVYQKTDRGCKEFVYGKEAKFKWVCNGSDPCSWCRLQEKQDPKPLSEWAFDHVNGFCSLEPADKTTTEAFNKLLGI